MYFEVSGVNVSPFIPPLVAFIISFFTSMGGVSGAFLILPFQVSVLGFTSPAVSSTNQLYNIVAIPSGVYRYIKEGRMVWPLTWIVIIGTLPGVFIGALLRISYLPNPTHFKIFAGFLLLYIGIKVVLEVVKRKKNNGIQSPEEKFQEMMKNYKNNSSDENRPKLPRVTVKKFNISHLIYDFYGETYDVQSYKILIISFIVGIVGGVYGIGGGAIMAPIFVAFFRLPVYTVAGAALMGTFITSVAGVIYYQILSNYYPGLSVAPDWPLGFLFGIGGFAGMYCGARLQKYVSPKIIKWILGISITSLALNYIRLIFEL
ncbi:MAG: sulfite exporter TauE/SafE family protein [Bacteroidetes bacterium]|nr:sulfite exporter TauE/SafE family protein [Bacteroidota bacterium]